MRGRPKRKRCISFFPEIIYFKPAGIPLRQLTEVILSLDEIESIRLAELNDMEQIDAAKEMNISRITFQRILHQAHKKIAEVLIYGKALKMEGGEIMTNEPLQKNHTLGRNAGRGQGTGGSEFCICPKCKKEIPHQRGIPCIQQECPDCKVSLRGKFCK